MSFTADHTHFFYANDIFIPLIQEGKGEGNVHSIRLPAGLEEDLSWESQIISAEDAVKEGKLLFWQFDFGFEKKQISLKDSALFYSFGIALEQFFEKIWSKFKEETFGVSLFRGSADFSQLFIWDQENQDQYLEWLKDTYRDPSPNSYYFSVYCAHLFSEYLQRLISYLPDQLLVFCLLDLSFLSRRAEAAHLLSKEHFSHLHLAVKGAFLPLSGLTWQEGNSLGGWIGEGSPRFNTSPSLSIAFSFPGDYYCSPQILSALEKTFRQLQERKISYRLIPESLLVEQWDGIDFLIVHSESLSPQGRRALKGFCAAGGTLVVIGEPLSENNAFCEVTFPEWEVGKKIGAEGFEPPTHCSQSSCASQ